MLFKTGVAGGIGEFLIRFLKLSCFLFFYKREREKGRDKRREEREIKKDKKRKIKREKVSEKKRETFRERNITAERENGGEKYKEKDKVRERERETQLVAKQTVEHAYKSTFGNVSETGEKNLYEMVIHRETLSVQTV